MSKIDDWLAQIPGPEPEMMTVGDLVASLRAAPQELPVWLDTAGARVRAGRVDVEVLREGLAVVIYPHPDDT